MLQNPSFSPRHTRRGTLHLSLFHVVALCLLDLVQTPGLKSHAFGCFPYPCLALLIFLFPLDPIKIIKPNSHQKGKARTVNRVPHSPSYQCLCANREGLARQEWGSKIGTECFLQIENLNHVASAVLSDLPLLSFLLLSSPLLSPLPFPPSSKPHPNLPH